MTIVKKIIALLGLLLSLSLSGMAQDSVPTAGITFTPIMPSAENSTRSDKNITNDDRRIDTTSPVAPKSDEQQTLLAIFGVGFLGGLAALFMPCIFPMLPLTISYFAKKAPGRFTAVSNALLYGVSIIGIYVVLGILITVLFGADALNRLATHGVFNLVFFGLLVLFAASFLGAFELTLPNKWVNQMDERSDRPGYLGLFFMAATLALISFSCTGPIIGTLLVQAAVSGSLLGPATGMLGFSLALAIPFTLFALFPGWLRALPKSGGWLNRIKVVLGFLELAFSLKFLSNVDLVYHWNWFDREVFLGLWIIIFGLMGPYLLGSFRLNHDSNAAAVSVPRLFLAIIPLSFSLYMVPGLWGAPLKAIAAFLPPATTQDFDLYTSSVLGSRSDNRAETPGGRSLPARVKYANLFDAPLTLNAFFDYKEGMAYARKVHKPVLLDFTGHACVNCRKMEATVWPDQAVFPMLRGEYVLIQLYVDDRTALPLKEQYTSSLSSRRIATVGSLNGDLQALRFNSNSQPYYVLLNPNDEKPLVPPIGAQYDPVQYGGFLKKGLRVFL